MVFSEQPEVASFDMKKQQQLYCVVHIAANTGLVVEPKYPIYGPLLQENPFSKHR